MDLDSFTTFAAGRAQGRFTDYSRFLDSSLTLGSKLSDVSHPAKHGFSVLGFGLTRRVFGSSNIRPSPGHPVLADTAIGKTERLRMLKFGA